mmetsp:Transcript_5452/g.16146  ORF Transcript_5452/g.16146 Transcript_5452/m.16146 type:complete len:103 (+) Transcript_5452:44-352(+)
MRAAVSLRGHSMSVDHAPGNDKQFALNFGLFVEQFARSAGGVCMIRELGKWQQKEMRFLSDQQIWPRNVSLGEFRNGIFRCRSSFAAADGDVREGEFRSSGL